MTDDSAAGSTVVPLVPEVLRGSLPIRDKYVQFVACFVNSLRHH